MKQLFQWMNEDENIRAAVAAFSKPGCHSIYGISGSVKSALTAKALTEKGGQAVLVVPSREQAQSWAADLAFLAPDVEILDFPVVDKAVFTTTAQSLDRKARQMEVLGRLRQGDSLLVIAAPEEAAQYVMAPQRVDAAAIDLAVGEAYDRDDLLQHFVDAGYERVDMVERRGHFSVRGDIIDVFAVNEPQPLRLEFFGAVIQAVAGLFNPATTAEVMEGSTSIVGIAVMSGSAIQAGVSEFLLFMAMISTSLGIMNLLPIPPLDGGRFVIEVFQKIARRTVSLRALNALSLAGMALFLCFFVMVNQDVQRFIFGNW